MVYLQVRDFPEELHTQLKLRAKKERRSVAHQTIIAIEEHLSKKAEETDRAKQHSFQQTLKESTERTRDSTDYLKRRKEVLSRIRATPKPFTKISPEDILEVIYEGRAKRDARIGL